MPVSSVVYRALFENSTNAYMLLDRALRFVDANPAYLALVGMRREDLIGHALFELFPHDAAAPDNDPQRRLRDSLMRVLATRERDVLAHIPYRVPRVPGGPPEERIWSATHTPILDAAGEVEFILQHTQDVTALRAAEAHEVLVRAEAVQRDRDALDDQIAQLRAMLDQAPGFFALVRGPDHVFEVANQAYVRLVGGRALLGVPLRTALPEIASQGYLDLLDRVYATGEPFVGRAMRVELRQPDRTETDEAFLDFLCHPVKDPAGATVGIVVQGHEVTEQHRTAARQAFLTRASESFVQGPDEILAVDAVLRRVADIAVQTLADVVVVEVHRGDDRERVVAARTPADAERAAALPTVADAARPMRVAHLGEEVLRRSGIRSVITVPLRSGEAQIGILAFASATRRYDAADLAVFEELARIATTALDNARLARERAEALVREQAARERAEMANRAKDDFLAMLGHELRNPLAPVLTAVQLLRLRGLTPPPRELDIIERQANHMVRLVDDLLDVARITRGKIQLRLAAVDLGEVAAKAVEIATPAIEAKQHRLRIALPPGGVYVRGDGDRLTQVIANLLTNAARYTNPGGAIDLALRRDGDDAVLAVRDDGIGIAPEVLPTIFDQFVQAPQSAARSDGGLGLGLTLVRALVAMHHGKVEARSEGVGRGTELRVRLPVLREAPDIAPRPAPEVLPAGGRTILVVDDNVDAAVLLGELLEGAGHRVTVAHDGHDALARALAERPQVAVIDIGLPGLDGYELATRIALELGDAAPHMVALTGYGAERDRERSRVAGFAAHLTKPVSTSSLLAIIELSGDVRARA